jgi:hypothetical protein
LALRSLDQKEGFGGGCNDQGYGCPNQLGIVISSIGGAGETLLETM